MGDALCLFCDEPATIWCDQALGMVWTGEYQKFKGQAAYRITTMESMLSHNYTCSAPCCSKHAYVAGFICGKDGGTIDRCAGCHESPGGPVGLATPAEIDVRRRRLHTTYRRNRIALVEDTPADGRS